MEKSLETTFRENLRFYRRRAELSQEKLSLLLDKNINYINLIEGGKSIPPLSVIEQIAKILEIEPHQLLIPQKDDSGFDKKNFIDQVVAQISENSREILKSLLKNL